MSPHPLPTPSTCRGRRRHAILHDFPGRILRAAAVAAGIGGPVGVVSADPPAPSRPAGAADAVLSQRVLTAIDQDPVLRRVNLVVSVVDGVAVIGGPVSSPAVSKRAEEVVRRVPEIKDVRNGCFVASRPDPLLEAVADRMRPSTLPPRPSMVDLPGVVSGPQAPPPAGINPNLVASGQAGATVVVQKPAMPAGEGLLGAPVGPGAPGAAPTGPAASRNPGSSTAPGLLTGSGAGKPSMAAIDDILTAAGNVKKVEARFARLTIEYKDGVLVIGGTSPRAADAWDLAEKLRQIPGVTRVAVAAAPGR